jgi:hypothetical protein
MGRLLALAVMVLAAAIVLPTVAAAAWAAIPFLSTLIAVLLIWRMAFPPRPRRR